MEDNQTQTIFMSDYGVIPNTGEDCTAAVQAVIKKLVGVHQVRLVFAKGHYTFKDKSAELDYSHLMQGTLHPNTFWGKPDIPYNRAIAIQDTDGIEIDGQGSTFIFHGLVQPFEFRNCTRVLLQNLSMDWDRPLFSNGTLLSLEDDTALIEFDPEYPLQGNEPVWSVMAYDRDMNRFGRASCFPRAAYLEKVSEHVYRSTAPGFRRFKPGVGMNVRHTHNYRPGIYIADCSNVTIQEVTIYAAVGMGVIGFHSNNITFERFQVRPAGRRFMSTNTDATHFISCTGLVSFKDCYFEGMGDDAANLHGFYLSTVGRIDSHTLLVTIDTSDITQCREFDSPFVGDELEFVRASDLSVYARNKVVSIQTDELAWTATIVLEDPLPSNFQSSDLIANATRTAKFLFANSTVTNNRARALLVQTRDVTIENCLFDSCTGTGIHVNAASNWKESIGTREVTIRNNVFRKCGYGDGTIANASAIAVTTESETTCTGVHKQIRIENNEIQGLGGRGIYMSATSEGVVMNNTFDHCTPAIHIEHCDHIRVEDNYMTGQDRAPAEVTGDNFST